MSDITNSKNNFTQTFQRYIDGMELVQYSIMNAPDNALPVSEKQDWITFFKRGHLMKNLEFDRYSDHTNKIVRQGVRGVRKGVREGEHKKASEIARKMLVRGRPLEEIDEDSGLT